MDEREINLDRMKDKNRQFKQKLKNTDFDK